MSIYKPSLDYYVYAYLREDGTPYYIGKGKGKRAYTTQHRTIKPPQNKSKIIFLEKNLTEIGAFALERRYIRWYGKIYDGGILRNMADGGEGNTSKRTQSHKDKISKALIGKSKNKGIPKSKEHRRNLSKAMKGKVSPRKNVKLTEETKRKMSESRKKYLDTLKK